MEKIWLKEYEKNVPATIDYPKVPTQPVLEIVPPSILTGPH